MPVQPTARFSAVGQLERELSGPLSPAPSSQKLTVQEGDIVETIEAEDDSDDEWMYARVFAGNTE